MTKKKKRNSTANQTATSPKVAQKKKGTVILFPDKSVKVIDFDDGSDDDLKANPENTVLECRTTGGLKRSDFHYKPDLLGNYQAPELKLAEDENRDSEERLAVYSAWCYGTCNPAGIACAPGKVPTCVLVAGQWILKCVDSKHGDGDDDDECDEK